MLRRISFSPDHEAWQWRITIRVAAEAPLGRRVRCRVINPTVVREYKTRMEAELAVSALRGSGIRARMRADDAGGQLLPFLVAVGAQVIVSSHNCEAARCILASDQWSLRVLEPHDEDDPEAA